MLVYVSNKSDFINDVRSNLIAEKVQEAFKRHLGHSVAPSEFRSWRESLRYMRDILDDEQIPSDAGVAIEYKIPQTSNRVDFILTGKNEKQQETAIIVELKQWEKVSKTEMDGIVSTYVGGGYREVSHPSYQAWTYAALLEDFSETVQTDGIGLKPCAYLHNCSAEEVINSPFYQDHTNKAPAFLQRDAQKLTDFIKRYVKFGDTKKIMYRIDNGRIRPSKNLADTLVSMIKGNPEFLMIDDQKIVYEKAMELAKKSTVKNKHVLIIEGGPGTGKSVVAINLLVALTELGLLAQYVSKNAAPRTVYASKLSGTLTRTRINNLFKGSGCYHSCTENEFDALIVDEAHRLNEKSGMFQNIGENQIKEIIRASKFTVFFLDEDQRIHFKDIGETEAIKDWTKKQGATVHHLELSSQFRCNGSNGYLSWLDDVLQVRKTANETLDGVKYDFKVFDSPNALRGEIFKKNENNNKARLVAGYCWDWVSKRDAARNDIVIEEHGFEMKWNLASDGSLWIIKPESVTEVGCIHTCQGLELDYIGVIIGPDLIVRDGKVLTDASRRSKMDTSIKGYKTLLRNNESEAKEKADAIIKNTYRTLMSRGMKGCYIFCVDEETNAYFKERIGAVVSEFEAELDEAVATEGTLDEIARTESGQVIPFPILRGDKVKPFENCVPLYDLAVAAGQFSETQVVNEEDMSDMIWVETPDYIRPEKDMFVTKVVGESMNRKIPNGSWCLFKAHPVGSRNGKIVLAKHHSIDDPDTGSQFTIKRYRSEKTSSEIGEWQHSKIILEPDSTDNSFKAIEIEEAEAEGFAILAEFLTILDPEI